MQFYLKSKAGWAEQAHVELSRPEEAEDTKWTAGALKPHVFEISSEIFICNDSESARNSGIINIKLLMLA